VSILSIRLPDSLHDIVRKMSKEDNISINQFVASALAEKVTALKTEEYISERAKRGSREKFLEILSKVPNVAPEKFDL